MSPEGISGRLRVGIGWGPYGVRQSSINPVGLLDGILVMECRRPHRLPGLPARRALHGLPDPPGLLVPLNQLVLLRPQEVGLR